MTQAITAYIAADVFGFFVALALIAIVALLGICGLCSLEEQTQDIEEQAFGNVESRYRQVEGN